MKVVSQTVWLTETEIEKIICSLLYPVENANVKQIFSVDGKIFYLVAATSLLESKI